MSALPCGIGLAQQRVSIGSGAVFGQLLFFAVEPAAQLQSAFAVGLRGTNLAYGAFDGCVAALEYASSLLSGVGYNLASLFAQRLCVGVVALQQVVESFFLLAYVHTLVFPVTAVAVDIVEVSVEVHVVASGDFFGMSYDFGRQTCLTGYIDGERTARMSD